MICAQSDLASGDDLFRELDRSRPVADLARATREVAQTGDRDWVIWPELALTRGEHFLM
jgi:hypothetical protein